MYWKQLQRCGNPGDAVRSVRMKFLDEICSSKRDPHFFVGTVLKYNSWIILGVFWPPKTEEEPAFDF
ncbi:MAG: hypothetical protein IT210_04140 [Armatimonadetes bacterium]|nr:hypothetical protein [Armatimonadota bacterium]